MKTCAKCKQSKEYSEFNKDRQQKDGYGCYCRICSSARSLEYIRRPDVSKRRKKYALSYYAKNKDRMYAYTLNWRRKNREKVNAITKAWEQSADGKAWKKAYRTARPELAQAREAVRKAIRHNKIYKPSECELCWNTGPVEAHHYKGYEKKHWLSIQWLCVPCHNHANRK